MGVLFGVFNLFLLLAYCLPSLPPTLLIFQSPFKDSLLCLSIPLIISVALLFLQYLFQKHRTGRTQETIQNPSISILKLVCSFPPLTAADAHSSDGWKHSECCILRTLWPILYTSLNFICFPNQSCPVCRGYHTASHKSLPGQWQLTMYQAERENLSYPNWPAVFTNRSNTERQVRIDVSTSVSGTNARQMVPSPPWDPSSTMLLVVLARTFLQSYLFLRTRRHHGWVFSSSCSEISPLFLLKDWLFQSEFHSVTPWFLMLPWPSC